MWHADQDSGVSGDQPWLRQPLVNVNLADTIRRSPFMPIDSMPTSSSDMIAMAEELLDRYREDPTPAILLSAILTANHVIDWYCEENGLKLGSMRDDFTRQLPEWETLRQISNGVKHVKPKEGQHHHCDLSARLPEWEDSNFWTAIGTGNEHWYINLDGYEQPVENVCRKFLSEFQLYVQERT